MTESEQASIAIQDSMPTIHTGIVVTSTDFENWHVDMLLEGTVIRSYNFNSRHRGDDLLRTVFNIPTGRKKWYRRLRTSRKYCHFKYLRCGTLQNKDSARVPQARSPSCLS